MKKLDKKTIIYIAIGIIAVIVVFLLLKKSNKDVTKTEKGEKEEQQNTGGGSGSSGSSNLDTILTQNASFPLKLTSPMKRGWNVKQLQMWLNKKARNTGIYATIIDDGIFGQKTETLLYNITGKNTMTEAEFNSYGIYGMF